MYARWDTTEATEGAAREDEEGRKDMVETDRKAPRGRDEGKDGKEGRGDGLGELDRKVRS